MKPRTVIIDAREFNVNQPIGKWSSSPQTKRSEGWYELSPERGRWFFRRRDPVIVLDAWRLNPVLCHVSFIDLNGWIMCENKFNGFTPGAVPPNADRIYPVDLFHPLNAAYAELP